MKSQKQKATRKNSKKSSKALDQIDQRTQIVREIGQSQASESGNERSYNLKQHEFNQFDYTLENWIDRRFTFENIRNDYHRVVNGPTRTRRSHQPSSSQIQDVAMPQIRAPPPQTPSLGQHPSPYSKRGRKRVYQQTHQDQAEVDNLSIKQSTDSFMLQSQISEDNLQQQAKAASNTVIQIESSEDGNPVDVQESEQVYYVQNKKSKTQNFDLSLQQDAQPQGLTNLLVDSLREKHRRTRPNFCKRKLQPAQIKKNFEVAQQLYIKIDC